MGFFQLTMWGVRLWILLYLVVSILFGIGVAIYWFREKIKEKYYKLRFPEKVIKCIVYYPGNIYRIFWRLIPKGDTFDIDKRPYLYADKQILKSNDLFVKNEKEEFWVEIEGKRYNVTANVRLKEKWSGHWPELHYKFNNPYPIDYSKTTSELKWSGEDFSDFKENDLFKKLLTMDQQKGMMMFLFIITGLNLVVSIIIFSKMMGWLK